jgi:hypothetical protein
VNEINGVEAKVPMLLTAHEGKWRKNVASKNDDELSPMYG